MTLDRSGRSFNDIELARDISQRLSGRSGKPQTSASLGYIRFSAARFTSQDAQAATSSFGPALWNEMLRACVESTRAELAFVVDDQGLIIASHGDAEPALIEGIGARLLIAFEHTDQMSALGEPSESIAIQMGQRWLTGLRTRLDENKLVVLGVLGPEVISQEARETIERFLQR